VPPIFEEECTSVLELSIALLLLLAQTPPPQGQAGTAPGAWTGADGRELLLQKHGGYSALECLHMLSSGECVLSALCVLYAREHAGVPA
jgi:hypothetical protein